MTSFGEGGRSVGGEDILFFWSFAFFRLFVLSLYTQSTRSARWVFNLSLFFLVLAELSPSSSRKRREIGVYGGGVYQYNLALFLPLSLFLFICCTATQGAYGHVLAAIIKRIFVPFGSLFHFQSPVSAPAMWCRGLLSAAGWSDFPSCLMLLLTKQWHLIVLCSVSKGERIHAVLI